MPEKKSRAKRLSLETKAKIAEELKKGTSAAQIGRDLGLKYHQVIHAAKTLREGEKGVRGGRKARSASADSLEALHNLMVTLEAQAKSVRKKFMARVKAERGRFQKLKKLLGA